MENEFFTSLIFFMRFLLSVLLIIVFAFIAGLYLPWWCIALISFFVLLIIPQGIGTSFLAGFLSIFLLWAGLALIIDIRNESILSQKIASLFSLGEASFLLILITGLLGGLVAGFAAMSGSTLRLILNR
jgi:hypothetical protein